MKNYYFAMLCLVVSVILEIFRGNAGVVANVIAAAILVTSFVTTSLGAKAQADNMWVRMAIAIVAPAIIGFATMN